MMRFSLRSSSPIRTAIEPWKSSCLPRTTPARPHPNRVRSSRCRRLRKPSTNSPARAATLAPADTVRSCSPDGVEPGAAAQRNPSRPQPVLPADGNHPPVARRCGVPPQVHVHRHHARASFPPPLRRTRRRPEPGATTAQSPNRGSRRLRAVPPRRTAPRLPAPPGRHPSFPVPRHPRGRLPASSRSDDPTGLSTAVGLAYA